MRFNRIFDTWKLNIRNVSSYSSQITCPDSSEKLDWKIIWTVNNMIDFDSLLKLIDLAERISI